MTTERIKKLKAKVVELGKINAEQDRTLDHRAQDIEMLQDEITSLIDASAQVDCGSAQLNRTAFTCRLHETCLTCERDQLRSELETLRKQRRGVAV